MRLAAARESVPASVVIAAICCALIVAPSLITEQLALDRQALLAGEAWRLWTGHLVHFSIFHALLDVAVLLIVCGSVERAQGTRRLCIALAIAAPLISLGLLAMAPGMMVYRGASGLAACMAVIAGVLLWRKNPGIRSALVLAGAVFTVKTVLDATFPRLGLSSLPADVSVAWQAHMLGAIVGSLLLCGRRTFVASVVAIFLSTTATAHALNGREHLDQIGAPDLAGRLAVGDVVFIRVSALPFKKVASTTESWTNHVGIVIDISGKEPLVGESTFPFSKATPLSQFVARSEAGRVEVSRLNMQPTPQQQGEILSAARKRLGILYDTGFDLNSRRQFCSRYVYEVLRDATDNQVGDVEDFSTLLTHNPNADLTFWRIWYFGKIPWQRRTVTPASLLRSAQLHTVFDGSVAVIAHRPGDNIPPVERHAFGLRDEVAPW